jgi:hypothetical protein
MTFLSILKGSNSYKNLRGGKKIVILESSRKSGNGLLWCVAPLQLKCKRLNLNIQWELCVIEINNVNIQWEYR